MSREMKNSGIDCIGAIPIEWEVVPIKHLCLKITDGSHYSPERTTEGRHYITVSDLYSDTIHYEDSMLISQSDFNALVSNGCKPNVGDILLSKDGSVGRSAIVYENDYVVLSSLGILSPNFEKVDNRYLKRLLDSDGLQEQMRNAMAGSAIKRITLTKINSFIAILPPLPEQKSIADFLDKKCDEIDEMIALQEKIIEELKAYKQSVITEAVTKGLNPDVPMKDSGISWIGEIPEGWDIMKTLYVLQMSITDGPHTTPELYEDGVPFVSAEAVSCGNGRIDFDHIRGYISQDFYEECCQKYIPKRDDVYMIKSGATTGKVSIVDTDIVFTIWSPLAVFRANEKVLPYFLFYMLQAEYYQEQIRTNWSYGTQQNIGMRTLEKLFVIIPTLSEQKSIVEYLDKKCSDIDSLISTKNAKIEELKEYKKSIIYEYVTGKKEVN